MVTHMENSVLSHHEAPNGKTRLVAVLGDLTMERVDAIVNAANSRLAHGGGVAGAIAKAGGPTIQRESNLIAPIKTGQAGITSGGNLPARFVIHAVGPVWGGGANREPELLESAVLAALGLASKNKLLTVALPIISAGIFGYPPELAVRVILGACLLHCKEETTLSEIRVCSNSEKLARLVAGELKNLT